VKATNLGEVLLMVLTLAIKLPVPSFQTLQPLWSKAVHPFGNPAYHDELGISCSPDKSVKSPFLTASFPFSSFGFSDQAVNAEAMKTVSVRIFEFIVEGFILIKLQNKLPQSTDIIAKSKHSSANNFLMRNALGAGEKV
jgi:hypothetical protein